MLKNEQGPAQKCDSNLVKSAHRPAQKCATTSNNTITENNERTIASPTPQPSAGQASATLAHRRGVSAEGLKKFEALFGRAVARTPMTQEQFEKRRAEQIAALCATSELKT